MDTGNGAGTGGRDVLAMLYVVSNKVPAQQLADAVHAALAAAVDPEELLFGVSVLPYDAGMWLRLAGDDTTTMARANTLAWAVAHQLLTGTAAPLIRKS